MIGRQQLPKDIFNNRLIFKMSRIQNHVLNVSIFLLTITSLQLATASRTACSDFMSTTAVLIGILSSLLRFRGFILQFNTFPKEVRISLSLLAVQISGIFETCKR